ncbi:MAG: hypothetical protein IJ091_07345, partial [Oscillospiraceae bacterium]|nr:hypothetical protein [Oscillospiraceae bacterium]
KDYLILSRKYARKIFFRKLRNRVSIFLLVSVFLFFVVAAAWLLSNLNRAKTESALITAEVHETDAAEMFILMADGVSNLTIDGVTRGALFNRMNEVVNMNWTTTPTGYNYRHRLYDPHLLGNERYLETLSDNGHALIWDTWTGKIDENFIASQEGVKAYYVDPENNCVIAVAEDNVVYFGDSETDQWMTNGVPFPFSGNTDIHIRSTLGQIIIYDDQNEFFFETEPTIALRSYVTNETMEGKDYRIHSVFLNENGPVTAVESNGSMSMYFRGEDGRLTGYSASVRPDPDCDAAANENYIVFADTEGNILILDRISKEYYTVGLKLPDVRFLSCINDSVFVYHDAMTGTHLYDFRQCIDLGTILTGCEDISYLGSGDHTVFCYADGAYHCQSVSSLLPKSEIDETQVLKRWSGTSPSDGDMLRNVAYGDDGFVHYTLTVYDNGDWIERGYILDGANLRRTGDKVSDIYAKEPETYAYYREPLTWTGDVTVLGVTDEGFCLLIGTDDGQFREISFGYDGGWYEDAYLQIPSHSAVTEILETEDHFLLKDAAGNYWEAGKMYPSHTDGSFALKEMNRKLKMHGYFKKELLDFVDKQTIQDTGIGLMPGGDGKEWE